MTDLLRRLAALYRAHPVEVAGALAACLVVSLLKFSAEMSASDWPQQWSLQQRIHFQRFEHAIPQFTYLEGGSQRLVPYLGSATKILRSGDSISKSLHANRLYLIRDSAGYQLTSQWVWNETTRDFEVAGCTRIKK